MSSLDSIYKKMAASLEPGAAGNLIGSTQSFDPARHIAPAVAHELNNILTIIQGYSDRMLIKNADYPALQPNLKMISDAARRAAIVIREATPPRSSSYYIRPAQTQPATPPEPVAA